MPHAACPRSATARALVPVAGQGMARTNTDILAISELKWTGMSIFNSDDQLYLLPWTRMPQKKWRSPHSQQKSLKCRTWMQSEKWQNDLCLFARQAIQCHSNPSHAPTINAEEAETEQFYEDLQDLLELTPKKDVLFIIGDWNANVGSQEIPGVMGKFGLGVQNEAGQMLTEFCQENSLVTANTLFQQHKRRLYTWTSSDGQYLNQIAYILCSQRWRSYIQSAKTKRGADCGWDHELLIVKFRLKLKKIGKTTKPFR